MSPATASVLPVIDPLSQARSPEILALGPNSTSPCPTSTSPSTGALMYTSPKSASTSPSTGPSMLTSPKSASTSPSTLPFTRMSPNPECTSSSTFPCTSTLPATVETLSSVPLETTSPTSRCSAAYAGSGSRNTRQRITPEMASNERALIL